MQVSQVAFHYRAKHPPVSIILIYVHSEPLLSIPTFKGTDIPENTRLLISPDVISENPL